MQRLIAAVSASVLLFCVAFVGGCGSEADRTSVEASPEAKKADSSAQDAMKAFMQSKSSKGKPASK
jgi:hypothetical protein